MQCWRQCPLPPAQPSVALGSSASPPSMRSTITKLIELSLFSKVAGTKYPLLYISFSSILACLFILFSFFFLLTVTLSPHTFKPVCEHCARSHGFCTHNARVRVFTCLFSSWAWLGVGLTVFSAHLHEVWHPHLSSLFYQPWQTIMSQRKLSPRSYSYLHWQEIKIGEECTSSSSSNGAEKSSCMLPSSGDWLKTNTDSIKYIRGLDCYWIIKFM